MREEGSQLFAVSELMGCSWASREGRRPGKSAAKAELLACVSRREGRDSMAAPIAPLGPLPSRLARSAPDGMAMGPTIWKRPASAEKTVSFPGQTEDLQILLPMVCLLFRRDSLQGNTAHDIADEGIDILC